MAVTWKQIAFQSSVSTADSKAVSAGTAASTADSKAVSAASLASSQNTSQVTTISTADSKAVSAGTAASVADSKAVSAASLATSQNTSQVTTISTADSKAVSAGTAASTADSKAVSAASLASSQNTSQVTTISTADSKAVSAGTAASVADSKAVSAGAVASGHNHAGVYEPVLGNPAGNGYVLASTTGGTRSWVEAGGGGVTQKITATHSFSVGNVVYFNGSSYALAKADSADTLGLWVVCAVTGTTDFTLQQAGPITGLAGLTAGQYYFLSAATAGLLTSTAPSDYSNPLLFATSTTTGWVLPFRPSIETSSTVDTLSPDIETAIWMGL